jgi:deoxyribodipyrimidine photo-lyase
MTDAPTIVWFRRDLRLNDHLALHAAVRRGQRIVPLFIFDDGILASDRVGAPRLDFMLAALRSLDADLRAFGARLIVRRGEPLAVLRAVASDTGAAAVYFSADYTPYARRRDGEVHALLGLPVEAFHDRLLVAPDEISTNSGAPYTVYTPFKNRWRELPKRHESAVDYTLTADSFATLDGVKSEAIPSLTELGLSSEVPLPPASERSAFKRLTAFTTRKIYDYGAGRDLLADAFDEAHNATSSLSPYIRFGLVSLRQIRQAAADAYVATASDDRRKSVTKWMDEVIWHEFYTHILWHFPQAAVRNYNEKYDDVEWRDAPDELQAWQEGLTGYPVVDAAMRQLKATGWMHNRARMITASFLTKDLLIDWRAGELHFMRWLLDGDLAANNGGWQWAAGTGTDAQPYFRIFNPVMQSVKFASGAFIRRWVPELRDVPDADIHEPWKRDRPPHDYPPPIVDHAAARDRTLAAYKAIKD